jgi:hypothetical protein
VLVGLSTMAANATLIAALRRAFATVADADKAAPMQAYMKSALPFHGAHFSDRGRLFQADRGRQIGAAVDALGRHASPGLNVAQSSTINLKRPPGWAVMAAVLV